MEGLYFFLICKQTINIDIRSRKLHLLIKPEFFKDNNMFELGCLNFFVPQMHIVLKNT